MARSRADLSGQKFGMLTCLCFIKVSDGDALWLFRCDCGRYRVRIGAVVKSGRACCCGCSVAQRISRSRKEHGMSYSPTYRSWISMKSRCGNTKNNSYGGRGIRVCDRWLNSFENFLSDMGERPKGQTIERDDVNGDYSPENCRWATSVEQNNNTTRTLYLTLNGETETLADWARKLSLPLYVLHTRYYLGWSDHDILTFPHKKMPEVIYLDHQGERLKVGLWAKRFNISARLIHRRLAKGISGDALFKPARKCKTRA